MTVDGGTTTDELIEVVFEVAFVTLELVEALIEAFVALDLDEFVAVTFAGTVTLTRVVTLVIIV